MTANETSRLSAVGYALRSKAAGKTVKTGEESTLKNFVTCVDNPGHFKLFTRPWCICLQVDSSLMLE